MPEPPFRPRWPSSPRLFGPFLRRWFHVLCSLYGGGSAHRAIDLHQYSDGPLLWIGCDCGRSFWGRKPDWMSFPNQTSAAGAAKGGVMVEGDWADAAVDSIIEDLNDRSGLGIDSVEDEIQEEIRTTWAGIIREKARLSGEGR